MQFRDVIILGAGAAGLMCAISAGSRGRRVLVLERSNRAGKKILMSGGGRCNFTNLYAGPEHYLSANPHFCKSALSRYTQQDFVELVEKHGIAYHEKTQGQLFCDGSSKEILAMLLDECRQAGVELVTGCEVERIDANGRFRLSGSLGEFSCDSLVVATGGLSIPTLGGSGFGYAVARRFGLKVLPTRAGLVPFTFTDHMKEFCSRLSGISVNARVSTGSHVFTENILFTHRGLSGPAVLQLSSFWSPGATVVIDLLPDTDAYELMKAFRREQPKALLRTLLSRRLPVKLVAELEHLWWPDLANVAMTELSNKILKEIAIKLKGWQLKPAGTEGYRTAEVTLGGVDTAGLSSTTMECKTRPGLYFVGEVVDVTGELGGFNFQWAWSSGYIAGMYV